MKIKKDHAYEKTHYIKHKSIRKFHFREHWYLPLAKWISLVQEFLDSGICDREKNGDNNDNE